MRPVSTADGRVRGSITVYCSLIVLMVAALIGTMLESAHIMAVRGYAKACTATAVDSLLSMYDEELFEQYGLLFLNEALLDYDIDEELYKCMLWGSEPGAAVAVRTPSMLSFELKEADIVKKYMAADDNGEFFFREVVDLMKYQETAELIASMTRYMTQIDNASSAYDYVVLNNKDLSDTDWEKMAKEARKEEEKEGEGEPEKEPEEKPAFTNSDVEASLSGSIIGQAEQAVSEGILKLFIDNTEELSDVIRECPLTVRADHGIRSEAGIIGGSAESVLFNEYVMSVMGNYLSPSRSGGFQYETEYIINGALSDKANLLGVLTKLLLIRMGLNIVFLLTDKSIGGQAFLMAEALVGFTCFPPLIIAVRLMIIAVWAFCESVLDVRTIISGEKVSFFKSEVSWTTDLADCVAQVLTGQKATASESGVAYNTYLRILLFMTARETRAVNTMKEITLVINSGRTQPFSFEDCVYGVETELSAEVRPVFASAYGFIKRPESFEIRTDWAQTY